MCSDLSISSLQKLKIKKKINIHRENEVSTIKCTLYIITFLYLNIRIVNVLWVYSYNGLDQCGMTCEVIAFKRIYRFCRHLYIYIYLHCRNKSIARTTWQMQYILFYSIFWMYLLKKLFLFFHYP